MPGARTPRGRVALAHATYLFWAHTRLSQIRSLALGAHVDGEGSEREHSVSQALIIRPPGLVANGSALQFLRSGKFLAQWSFPISDWLEPSTICKIGSDICSLGIGFLAVWFSFSKYGPVRRANESRSIRMMVKNQAIKTNPHAIAA
ncbi:hypothetical protein C8R45DRAFT_938374 [Mycena sanguinolenta]|nr:hypothetical protein C8R45DRAFT_938374 [Mycena sanguinolenta]